MAGPQDSLPTLEREDLADFIDRVERLPAATVVHIPVDQRVRHACLVAGLLDRMAAGDDAACALERARSKLLLGPVPKGANTRVELAKRLNLWLAGAFEELLVRAEEQFRARTRARAALRGAPQHGWRARRARALIGEGAYSKAAASLHTEAAELSAEEQLFWSTALLPSSSRPAAALAPQPRPAPADQDANTERADRPVSALRGVRFRVMSAPGPSGARPEHLRELVAVRDRRVAAQLLGAIGRLHEAAATGELCAAARWLLDSRLVFLRKKSGNASRPIRVDEMWRRVIAKRLVDANREKAQRFCLAARQFGVAVPSGAEGLVHFRAQAERLLAAADTATAIIDVDFKNAFPSIEWDEIRASVEAELPDVAPWTLWCHAEPARVLLPSGSIVLTNRGAEQGDPLGPIYCALVLARVVARARAALEEMGINFFDAWFLDDGQLVCAPEHADTVLRALDSAAAQAGASRATGADAKSVARVVGSLAARETCAIGWRTEYIQHSTTTDPARQEHVLGVDFGAVSNQFRRVTGTVAELHEAVALIGDTASELVLLRKCADVCKAAYLLRVAGPSIDTELLHAYDALLQRSLARCLGGHLDEHAQEQAALGVAEGGLGIRRAARTALPAFVASRVESGWIVRMLADALAHFLSPEDLVAAFDVDTAAAQADLEAQLPVSDAAQVRTLVQEASAARSSPQSALHAVKRRQESVLAGDGIVLPAGAEDEEFEADGLQAALCALGDRDACTRLLLQLDAEESHSRRRALLELRDSSVSHEWLWRVSRAHGPAVPPGEFQDAVRIRLGAPCAGPGTECARCGAALGACCAHALCCARREATRGHYSVRDEVLVVAHLAQPSASIETAGLVPSAPALRPADILTSAALPGRLAALDIGVTCPEATGAGEDCCDAMYRRKRRAYAPHLRELEEEQDVAYRPMVWSAYGRAHPETEAMLTSMAVLAARRRGLRDHRPILRRVRCAIGVALVRRAVQMVHACIPHLDAEEERPLFSSAEAPPHPQRRNICLAGDEAEAAAPA